MPWAAGAHVYDFVVEEAGGEEDTGRLREHVPVYNSNKCMGNKYPNELFGEKKAWCVLGLIDVRARGSDDG